MKHQDFDSWKACPTLILKPSLYCCFPWQGRSFCMWNVKGVLCQGHLSSAGGHPWGLHTRNRGLQHVSNDFTKIWNYWILKKHWKRTEHSKMCQLPPSQSIQMLQQEETKVLHCYDENQIKDFQFTMLFRPIFASKRVHGLGVVTKSRLSQDLVKKGEEMQTVDTMSDTSHQRQTFKPKLNTVCPITGRRKRYGTTRKKKKKCKQWTLCPTHPIKGKHSNLNSILCLPFLGAKRGCQEEKKY